MGDLCADQCFGDDANDFAACFKRAVRHSAHKAQAPAALDHANAALGKCLAYCAGSVDVNRVLGRR
jgi:hypothetical protein